MVALLTQHQRAPCLQGEVSTFDGPFLYKLDPPAHYALPGPVLRVLKMGNQLMIRLPGLISSVRNLRDPMQGLMWNTESNEEVIQLATELLGCQDDEGENALLHSLQIQPSDCGVAGLRCSFQFYQLNDFRAAMVYVHASGIKAVLATAEVSVAGTGHRG